MADIRDEIRDLLEYKLTELFEVFQDKLNIPEKNRYLGIMESMELDDQVEEMALTIATIFHRQSVGEEEVDDGVDEACEDGKCEKCDKPLKEEEKDNFVIYKEMDEYCVTPRSNYGGYTQNARKVHRMKDFTSAREVMDYWNKYFHTTDDDFEVIDEEKCGEAKCEEGKKCCPKIVDKRELK